MRGIPVAIAMAGGYAERIDDIVDIHFATVSLRSRSADRTRLAPPRSSSNAHGTTATLTLNRPDALNTLDFALMDALVAAAADVAADDALRVVVLRGAGTPLHGRRRLAHVRWRTGEAARPAQCRFPSNDRAAALGRSRTFTGCRIRSSAQVHGAVAGFGLSLMNACDLVVAAEDTYFASAYRNIALTPDGGGSWSLPRIVGMRRAMEILLLAERFDAQRALEFGLVNRVVAAADLEGAVAEIVKALAGGPVLAIRNAKRLLRESPRRTLSEQLDAEAVSFGACAATDDFVEGISAFLEKRPARFGEAT